MAEEKKKLNEVTAGEMSEIFKKLKDAGVVFRCNLNQISKHLLKEFLPVNPFSVDFQTLLTSFMEHVQFDTQIDEYKDDFIKDYHLKQKKELTEAMASEVSFHRYICKVYLDLAKEPRIELLEAYEKAVADLTEIDETLDDIQEKLDGITKRNNSTEIQEKKPILYYYQAHNENAKKAILTFIKNDIRDYALTNSYNNSLWGSLMMRVPYNYSWNPKSYKPRYPNDLQNKLGEFAYRKFLDIYKQYKEDKPGFYAFLTKYIADENIVFSIGDLLHHHHILDGRKEIIEETLDIYQTGSKIMFATAVPSIIEGIFHDLCILVGEKENDLLREGFQYKLDKLHEHLGLDLHYEYYAFRFRLFRYKVSHGRLTKEDVAELADLLLLDLYQVCKLVSTDKLDLNHKRFVVYELNKDLVKPDYKYLMRYILLDKTEIPVFYGLEKQIEEVEKLIVGQEFWSFLDEEVKHGGDPVKHGIHIVVKAISNRKKGDKRCAEMFRKIGLKQSDKNIANNYLKYLTRDF
ncbi:MAG: hypothetical protein ACO1N9_07275 [Flavobacterium sp.]